MRSIAQSTKHDNGRMASVRHESPSPRPRRTQGAPGSFSSPETAQSSRQFAIDLSEMVSIHTKNRLPVQDYADARQTFAGAEDSVDSNSPPVERVPS
jgi:hypothetical protein